MRVNAANDRSRMRSTVKIPGDELYAWGDYLIRTLPSQLDDKKFLELERDLNDTYTIAIEDGTDRRVLEELKNILPQVSTITQSLIDGKPVAKDEKFFQKVKVMGERLLNLAVYLNPDAADHDRRQESSFNYRDDQKPKSKRSGGSNKPEKDLAPEPSNGPLQQVDKPLKKEDGKAPAGQAAPAQQRSRRSRKPATGTGGSDAPPEGEKTKGEISEDGKENGSAGSQHKISQWLPDYDPDQTWGKDYLGIQPDRDAFAALIAARATTPPLSIGIFGEWGSGKTFFMRHLKQRVKDIAEQARNSGRMQKEISFYKHIVQVEFNAWHYSEGNLWASLVEHILSNLSVQDESQDQMQAIQKKLLSKLGVQKIAAEAAQRKVIEAKEKLVASEQKVKEKKEEFQVVSDELYHLKAQDILDLVLASPDIQSAATQLRQNFTELGIPFPEDTVGDLSDSIHEAQNAIRRGGAILMPFIHSPNRWGWIAIFFAMLVAAPVLGLTIGWLLHAFGQAWLSQNAALLTALTSWITLFAGFLHASAKWVSDRIAPIEQLKQRIDHEVSNRQKEIEAQIAELEKQRAKLEQEEDELIQHLKDAKRQVEQTEEDLKQITPARLLAQFIKDRVESADYRKHLGVLALVRNDFETLSSYIEKENEACDIFTDIKAERKDEACRINRIVLYIDDLDRCPSEKVIQVLQAVHLLLAFPLFVVVVAVDARWISNALLERYGQLMAPLDSNEQKESNTAQIGVTPLDYLEKIFQIPFWLSPMDISARQRMIEGLVQGGGMVEPKKAAQQLAARAREAPFREKQHSGQALIPDDGKQIQSSGSASDDVDLNPEALTIHPSELEFIKLLTPILGGSPRDLKRFINIYRLIKTKYANAKPAAVESSIQFSEDYPLVMYLLAIVTHLPEISQKFFAALYKFAQEHPQTKNISEDEWRNIVDELKETATVSVFTQLSKWTLSKDAAQIRNSNLQKIIWWARRVSRYSFLIGPG